MSFASAKSRLFVGPLALSAVLVLGSFQTATGEMPSGLEDALQAYQWNYPCRKPPIRFMPDGNVLDAEGMARYEWSLEKATGTVHMVSLGPGRPKARIDAWFWPGLTGFTYHDSNGNKTGQAARADTGVAEAAPVPPPAMKEALLSYRWTVPAWTGPGLRFLPDGRVTNFYGAFRFNWNWDAASETIRMFGIGPNVEQYQLWFNDELTGFSFYESHGKNSGFGIRGDHLPQVPEPPEGQDPVIGQWLLEGRSLIRLGAGHEISGERHGSWIFKGAFDGGRSYELRWTPPKNWMDAVTLSSDGKSMKGQSRGKPISYFRPAESLATAEAKSASPESAAPAPSPAISGPGAPAVAPATPAPSAASAASKADAAPSPSAILSQQALNAMEWALAPLDEKAPGGLRENVTMLREDLLDEAARKPAVSAAAYKHGQELCDSLIAAFDARDDARVKAGYTAAQSRVNMGEITNQALEARRRFTNWPTYQREKDQRGEARKQKENAAALERQRPVVEWASRAAQFRRMINGLYALYREAARHPLASH